MEPNAGLAIQFREGRFLTEARLTRIPLMLLAAFALALGFIAFSAHGLSDYTGKRPLGSDYSNIYAAGRYVLDGKPEAPFDPGAQYREEQRIFGPRTDFFGWHYPPYFLLLAAPLALLPYLASLALWQAGSFALYLAAMARLMRGLPGLPPARWLIPAIAFPAVFVNLTHGHNGFLTAGLMGFALAELDERPLVSGLCFGLMLYKPQFGLMIPLVLAVTGRWRVIAAAAATGLALTALVTALFGVGVWTAFLASTHFTRTVVLEQGGAGFFKIDSVFAWVRMWGGAVWLAYAVQGAVTFCVAAALVRLWRCDARQAVKGAALCLGALLSTPYSLDYDMMVLAPAIALIAADGIRQGFLPFGKSAAALLWIAPFLARPVALATTVPVGVLIMLAMFATLVMPPPRLTAV